MKTFTVMARIDVIKTYTIQAETLKEAQEIAETGEYNDEDVIDEQGLCFEVIEIQE